MTYHSVELSVCFCLHIREGAECEDAGYHRAAGSVYAAAYQIRCQTGDFDVGEALFSL